MFNGILSCIQYNILVSDQPITPFLMVADYADKTIIITYSDPIIVSHYLILLKDWYTKWLIKISQFKYLHLTFYSLTSLTPCPAVTIYGT